MHNSAYYRCFEILNICLIILDIDRWISVLNNAKEATLMKAFGESAGSESNPINQSVKELNLDIYRQANNLKTICETALRIDLQQIVLKTSKLKFLYVIKKIEKNTLEVMKIGQKPKMQF